MVVLQVDNVNYTAILFSVNNININKNYVWIRKFKIILNKSLKMFLYKTDYFQNNFIR